ncbi:MAG: flavin reductase family protein [Candidatus Sericytochromatia bacterium]|nr:flavin reductase family protein [Candidatus Sericytochromatia bacterium]
MIIDPSAGPWQDAYRLITGTVVPRPIAFVSTRSPEGVPNLAPFSFFTVVCARPLTICFAPMRRGPQADKKDTLKHIEATGEFVVNVVDERFADAMNLTSADFPEDVSEFEMAGLTPVRCEVVQAPRVQESPISLECRLFQIVEVSDGPGGGSLVIGTVVRAHVRDELMQEGIPRPGEAWQPISRCGGATYVRLTDTFELARPVFSPEQLAALQAGPVSSPSSAS